MFLIIIESLHEYEPLCIVLVMVIWGGGGVSFFLTKILQKAAQRPTKVHFCPYIGALEDQPFNTNGRGDLLVHADKQSPTCMAEYKSNPLFSYRINHYP